jgi:hypothetical protein
MFGQEKKMAIQRECGRCKGKGLIHKPYKDIWGGRHIEQECPVCHGSGRNPDYRSKSCEYRGCWTTIEYSSRSKFPPKYCEYHKGVVVHEKQEANAKRERDNRERAEQQRQRQQHTAQRAQYPHESNTSENKRFYAACGDRGAKLTSAERNRFSTYFHTLPNRERMSFDEIVRVANQWKSENGGGYRLSDR